ncbi:MBL fold metallo-hydrolase [soil metagenome]
MTVRVRFLGSGDAFGSGGRFQAAIAVEAPRTTLLLDCGATSLVALKAAGLDPGSIDAVAVSHFHGDHFGGIPFLILDAQFAKRRRPLIVAGPPGIEARVRAAFDALYPGSAATAHAAVEVRDVELCADVRELAGAEVTAVPVAHTAGVAAHGLRTRVGGRTIAYSGDTEWTDALVDLADGADLFVCECYTYQKHVPKHLDHGTLVAERARLRCARLVVTHLGPEMLAARDRLAFDAASDGMVVEL